jgi:signal transduction histidine kinase/FixJ family two-component response regulator
MPNPLRVLVVEDSEDDTLLLVRSLREAGFKPSFERVCTAEAMTAALARQSWDLIISDFSMPHFDGSSALGIFKQSGLDIPFIILSGSIGEEVAVAAMKAGAHDYVMKGKQERLVSAIERELREAEIRAKRREAEAEVGRNLARIKVLHEMDLAIMSTLDLTALLSAFLAKIDSLLPHFATTIRLFNEDTGELEPVACRNVNEAEWRGMNHRNLGGLAKIVLENKVPVTVTDVQTDPRSTASTFARKEGLVSYLGIPLVAKDHVLGILAFYTKQKHTFSDSEIEFLMTLAGQAAIGIHHSKLYEQLKQRNNQLTTLYSVAETASRFLDVPTVLLQTLSKISELFGFQAGRIYVYERFSGLLRLATHEGFPPEIIPPVEYQIGQGLIGRAFRKGEPLLIGDMQTDIGFQRQSSKKVMLSAGFRSSLFIPIRVNGETHGVMNFLSKEPRHFPPGEIRLLNAIQYHLGIAIANANLFREVQQKSLELEKSNKVKDEFLSVISHELRTPLNVCIGYATLVKDRFFGDVNPEQQTALVKALDHAQQLLRTLDRVLSLRDLEANAVKNDMGDIRLIEFMEQTKSYYTALPDQKISMLWDYPSDLPVLESDPAKLTRVLRNLLENSLKFTKDGYIKLSVRYLRKSNAVEFKVADTGPGIPKDKLPDIFEMFRQVDSSATREHNGLGIGLFIAKRLTDILGGKITVESNLGEGSTFTIVLPLRGPLSIQADLSRNFAAAS